MGGGHARLRFIGALAPYRGNRPTRVPEDRPVPRPTRSCPFRRTASPKCPAKLFLPCRPKQRTTFVGTHKSRFRSALTPIVFMSNTSPEIRRTPRNLPSPPRVVRSYTAKRTPEKTKIKFCLKTNRLTTSDVDPRCPF